MSVVYHTGNMRSKRNMLINSDFKINQRAYVSGTNTTVANQYTLDRWRIPTSGQNATFSETNGVVTVTAPASGIEQVIENVSNKGGEFTVYNQGTAVVTVSQSSDNVTYTTVTPTNGVYNITGGNYIKVNFASGTVKLPTFKDGSVVDTVWHPYDGEFGGELQASQRYYENIGTASFHGYGAAGNGFWNQHEMKVTKRVIPTITTGAITAQTNCGIGAFGASKDVISMSITVTGTGAFVADVSNVTASAEL